LRQGTPSLKLRTKFRSRIEKLEKSRSDIAGENAKRDDAIAELKAEVLKLRDDNEKNKQTQDLPRKLTMYLTFL
jgi:Skp family chaperone for outer membrane proteins